MNLIDAPNHPGYWMGIDPADSKPFFKKKPTYDLDFVFEVNGKKYVMQEEAFPTRSLLDKTMLLNRLQELEDERLAKQRTPIVMWTTEQGMREFDAAVKQMVSLERQLLYSPQSSG